VRREDGLGGDQVEGRRAVFELLTAGRRHARRVVISEAQESSELLDAIESAARGRRVPVAYVSRARLDREARTEGNQGVYALCDPVPTVSLADLCVGVDGTTAFLVVCDGVTDPRNLGALLRSAECAGVTGIVLPKHRSARLTPAVTKTASGAIERLDFAAVAGIPTALRELSDRGVVSVGLAPESRRMIYDLDLRDTPVAIVIGGEERGLSRLTRTRCDEVVAIPQHGVISSLNAGVAGAVACFEVARQRATRIRH
jgi:23S rRNA (guanosine2251-2'-O)-methyltransferase